MLRRKNMTALIVCGILGVLGAGAPAHADAVTDWNAITLDAVTAGRPGPIGMVDVALVQIAVHDAVQALDRRYEPYHVEIEGARGSARGRRGRRGTRCAGGHVPDSVDESRRLVFQLPG